MTDLLNSAQKAAVKAAFLNVKDTLYKTPITLMIRASTTKKGFGEGYSPTFTPIPMLCRWEYSKASGERYINVDETPKGKDLGEGIRAYLWKDDMDAALAAASVAAFNPEVDRVEYNGVLYEVRMFNPSNAFADIGPMTYEMDLVHVNR